MVLTVTKYDFRDAFDKSQYRTSFSRWALDEMFNYITQLEEDTGEQVELDPTAFACDYEEMTLLDVLKEYDTGIDYEETEDIGDLFLEVLEWLVYNTTVVASDDANCNFLFVSF